jgi:MtN3 and saliva related transmembrane protein
MNEVEAVGYLAGLLVSISLVPQVLKTWRTKSADDISLIWTIVLMSGLVLWIVYAILKRILPLTVFASIEFSMALLLCLFKLSFSKRR